MFLYSLLEVSEKTTNIVKWISVGAVALLLALIFLVSFLKKKKADTKRIAFAGVCVSMSFTLAIIKFSPIQYGGSITLASFVPILIYAYCFGAADGFIVGLIHGLLNFIESPYILNAATFIFDYLLAFMSVGIMGFFGKMRRKDNAVLPIVLGCICVFSARFVAHLVSGMVFFTENSVWVSLPDWAMGNAFAYSFIYQCVYIPADALIATLVLVFIAKSGLLNKLTKIMQR
jgi:thiamine transporter